MNVALKLNDKDKGAFLLMEGEEKLGEMEIGISGDYLTAYHTEIDPRAEGKGLSKMLLEAMTAYAREHRLKVIPLCPFVQGQFRKHAEKFIDIWEK